MIPLVVLDTNVMLGGIQFRFPDYRILKDAKYGSSFQYAITKSQVLDFQNSQRLKEKHCFKDLDYYTKKFNLNVLDESKRRYDPMIRKILRARSDLEESDIRTVENAMQRDAKHIISMDGHLIWKGLNDIIEDLYDKEISIITPQKFCETYDEKITKTDKMERAINRFKRGVLDIRGKT